MNTHAHGFDGKWPFREAENTAVFCCGHVFDDAPILYVTHDHDGDWQFLCGAIHEGEQPRVVCLGCMVEKDPSLWTLADMPAGWGADREHQKHRWRREANPEPADESSDESPDSV